MLIHISLDTLWITLDSSFIRPNHRLHLVANVNIESRWWCVGTWDSLGDENTSNVFFFRMGKLNMRLLYIAIYVTMWHWPLTISVQKIFALTPLAFDVRVETSCEWSYYNRSVEATMLLLLKNMYLSMFILISKCN